MYHFKRISHAASSVSSVAFLLFCSVFLLAPAHAAATLSAIHVTPENPVITNGKSQTFAAFGTYSNGFTVQLLGSPVRSVAVGYRHTCALLANGAVQCWGWNGSGQLGNDTSTQSFTPVTVTGISAATALAAGGDHTCALLASGAVQCWGDNTYGQLGNGTNTSSTIPVTVSGISTATALATGRRHTCALLAGGAVQCWGNNTYGQLGNGTTTPSNTPVTVSGISTAKELAVGEFHTCAVLASGAVQCWGANYSGQLGNGAANGVSDTPVQVNGIGTATALAAGTNHTCALLASGAVQCWGHGGNGELGNGANVDSFTPVTVSGINTANALSAGLLHSCALLASGGVECWGYNYNGQLGNGTTTDSNTPVTVSGISTATAIAAGSLLHNCALLSSGEVQCWGYNTDGDLGDGTAYYYSTTPVSVIGTPSVAMEWNSSDPSVASIDASGFATSHSPGGTRITATAAGINGSTQLTVVNKQSADLSLTMTDAPDPVAKNGALVYTLTVTNKGPNTAQHVHLNDTLPGSVQVKNLTYSQGSCGHWGLVKCWLGNLSSGASATVLITVQPNTSGWIVNSAYTWSNATDPNNSNNKAKTGTWVRK